MLTIFIVSQFMCYLRSGFINLLKYHYKTQILPGNSVDNFYFSVGKECYKQKIYVDNLYVGKIFLAVDYGHFIGNMLITLFSIGNYLEIGNPNFFFCSVYFCFNFSCNVAIVTAFYFQLFFFFFHGTKFLTRIKFGFSLNIKKAGR